MKLFPRSTFGRIAVMIGFLLLINQMVYYVTVGMYVVDPLIKQTMHLVAMQVKVHFLNRDGSVQIDPLVSKRYIDATHIETYDGKQAWDKGLSRAKLYQSLTDELNTALSSQPHPVSDNASPELLHSEVRIEESDMVYMWVQSPYNTRYWMRIPMMKFERSYPSPLLLYLTVITLLSTVGGWLFARQITRPLRRLEFAARELGRGDMPGTLKESGTQELVALTRSFNQMATNLRQSEQDRTMLLAGISHDLRTPITRIRLASEFLPPEHDDIKEGIVRDTEDMDEIIDQFISYVRDGRDERSAPGDFNMMVLHAAEPANVNGTDLIFDLTEVPPVPFKALAMKRLVRNLVENALRYAGAPVTLQTRVEGNHVVLSVLDNGPGVNEADIPRLFQPFTRGDSARSGRGTGLGLAIVKRIADMHNASISLSNRAEGGMAATLKIPYC